MKKPYKEIRISSTGYGGALWGEPFQLIVAHFPECDIQCIVEFNRERVRFIKIVDYTSSAINDVSKLSDEEFFQLSLVWGEDIDLYHLKTVQEYIHYLLSSKEQATFEDKVIL